MHFPTDINLLFDAMRKAVTLTAALCAGYGLSRWRQYRYRLRQLKRLYRQAQNRKRSRSKDPRKQAQKQEQLRSAHQALIDRSHVLLAQVEQTLVDLAREAPALKLIEIQDFLVHARRQIDQIERRVLQGEPIPHAEKVFSVFEPHTEWISKGKAGVPVELGLRVCVLVDQYGLVLHHQVMVGQTDDQVAVSMVTQTQQRFPALRACSFDQGFHSRSNQLELAALLDAVVLPKKGRLTEAEQALACSSGYVAARRAHSGVESSINALEVHGLDRCPDHGLTGFERYVALAVVARNVQQVGALLGRKAQPHLRRGRKRAA